MTVFIMNSSGTHMGTFGVDAVPCIGESVQLGGTIVRVVDVLHELSTRRITVIIR